MANTKSRVGLNPRAYEGVRAINPPDLVRDTRNPRTPVAGGTQPLDFNYDLGTLWLNTSTFDVFMLVNKVVNSPSNKVATWIQFNAATGLGIDRLIDNSGNPVVPTLGGDVNVIGDNAAGLLTVMSGANTLTITTSTGNPFLQTLTGNTGGAVVPDGSSNIDIVGNLSNGLTISGGVPGANSLEVQSRGGNRFIELLTPSSGMPVTGTAASGSVELESISSGLTITGDPGNNKVVFALIGGGGAGGVDLQDNAGVNATPDSSMIIKVQGLNDTGFLTVSQINQTGALDLNAMVVTSASGRHLFEGLLANNGAATRQDGNGEIALVARTSSGLQTFSNTDASGIPTPNSMSIGLLSGNNIVEGLVPDGGPFSPVLANGSGRINVLGGEVINTDGTGINTLTVNLDRGLDGQVIIGATGAASSYANITSLDGTVTITNGPNSIDLSSPGGGSGTVAFLAGNAGVNVGPDGGGTIDVVGNESNGLTVAENTPGANSLEIQSRGGNRLVEILRDDAGLSAIATPTAGAISLVTGLNSIFFDATVIANTMNLATASGDEVCLGINTVDDGNFVNPTTGGYVRFIEGANITITGNPGSNSVTITASGGGGGGNLTITPLTTADSPYDVLNNDEVLSCDVSVGPLTVRLPNSPPLGRVIYIKDVGGDAATNNISITTVGGVVTIDDVTTFTMNTAYQSVTVVFDGASYIIL